MVFTGVSGSGKSSLAFDTIYAEGQRRYVESLSAYARQFLERMEKPDVDGIDGIAPAIAIRQKNSIRNPRSTVGTTTEIHDYLRLLWARVGRTICRQCGKRGRARIARRRRRRGCCALPPGTRLLIGFDYPIVKFRSPAPRTARRDDDADDDDGDGRDRRGVADDGDERLEAPLPATIRSPRRSTRCAAAASARLLVAGAR